MLVLTRSDVRRLLDMGDCVAAVERAFAHLGSGRARAPAALGYPLIDGGFHIKVACLHGERPYFAAKTNGNFFRNAGRGLPRIQGVITLCDGDTGTPLATLDSIEITALRTAAASAVAARHLARGGDGTVALAGCGVQGRMHLRALRAVMRVARVTVFDVHRAAAERLASELAPELGVPIGVTADFGASARDADVIVTCTPSREPILGPGDVRPGAFVAAVGADAEDKHEIDPRLLAASAIVVDSLDQCAAFGDLHHAIRAGVVRRDDVRATLADIVAGSARGRLSRDEIVVFDSTGIATEDVAAAALVYERAIERDAGTHVDIGA